jgi:hypothetical protein
MGIPFGQQVDLWETMNKLHGTSSILAFLNHFSPFNGSLVALLMKSSVISNCTSPTLALKPSKVESLCNREVVAFKILEEHIPPMSLQVVYGVIMGQKILETIRLDTNYRFHCHCEKDTTDITGCRFRLPEDKEQREVYEKCNGTKIAKFGDSHYLEIRIRENENQRARKTTSHYAR